MGDCGLRSVARSFIKLRGKLSVNLARMKGEFEPDLHSRIRDEHTRMPLKFGVLLEEENIFYGAVRTPSNLFSDVGQTWFFVLRGSLTVFEVHASVVAPAIAIFAGPNPSPTRS